MISKELIDLMNGKIEVNSEIGKGTNFNFNLKIEKEKKKNSKTIKNYLNENKIFENKNFYFLENQKNLNEIKEIQKIILLTFGKINFINEKEFNKIELNSYFIFSLNNENLNENLIEKIKPFKNKFKSILISNSKNYFDIRILIEKEIENNEIYFIETPILILNLIQKFKLIFNQEKEKEKKEKLKKELNLNSKEVEKELKKTKGKILIVEDNSMNIKVMKKLLENENYEFEVAENGLIAIEFFEKFKFDLILMDIQVFFFYYFFIKFLKN